MFSEVTHDLARLRASIQHEFAGCLPYSVIETENFSDWLASLKERETRIRLTRRRGKTRRSIIESAHE
jgi:hypothetical protein